MKSLFPHYLALCSGILGGLISSASQTGLSAPLERPNIVWIISDDLSPDLGCYGEQEAAVKTPRIDALAEEGVRFTHVFGTSSVCSPNRSAYCTGMYQTTIGAQHHRTLKTRPLPEGVKTIPDYFREAGYFVSNGRPEDKPDEPMTRAGKLDWNFSIEGEPFDGTDWTQRAPGQPFFAQVNIDEAHRPWTRDMTRPVDPSKVTIPPYYPDHPLVRVDWSRYLEEVQVFDRKVGAILDRLEREGLADNTVVMVFGDNGRSFPRDKGYVYDGGLQVPLIIRWPDGKSAGEVDDRLISMIDFGPTMMEFAGIEIPDQIQGQSFLNDDAPGRKRIYAAKDRTGEIRDRIRTVRSRDFKYIRNFVHDIPYIPVNRYTLLVESTVSVIMTHSERNGTDNYISSLSAGHRPPEEFYDLRNDPFEMNNLAEDPEYADMITDFRSDLDRWVIESKDTGVVPETTASIAPYTRWLDKYLGKIQRECGIEEVNGNSMYAYWMHRYDLK
ncbi:MAG: sulfatase [Verrucomicrobiales bacterium]|nr:sulfatase [Verrucomicrobiales bacterium]